MSNIRLFFSDTLSANMIDKLDKGQSHYLSKVMRVKENEVFSLFNKEGEWEAKILGISKNIVNFKKNRRVALGPYATFYFESYETMLAQVQEMLYIEKGGDEQLHDELIAYNPLIPNGKELTATLMFEIDNPISRAAFLGKVGGIEEMVFMKINGETVKAVPEEDVDRTSAEGKAYSVQFIHFNFTDEQIQKFKSSDVNIELGVDHREYSHTTKLSKENIASLSSDFS